VPGMAVGLLEAGEDLAVIAIWLGHEDVSTTQIYLEATLAMKEKALAKIKPSARFRPGDRLLSFLNNL
jgi:site-specific recombinase XerD